MALMFKQFKRIYNVCRKIGHKRLDCFSLKKNEDKKNEWFKKRNTEKNCDKGENKPAKKNENKTGSKVQCWVCSKFGHKSNKCPDKKKDNKLNKEPAFNTNKDFILMMVNGKMNASTWIADSGASCHMTNDKSGFIDSRKVSKRVSVGDRRSLNVTKSRTWKGTFDGKTITLEEVDYMLELMCNLFSVTKSMTKGTKVFGTLDGFVIRNRKFKMRFKKRFHSPSRVIFGIDIYPTTMESGLIAKDGKKAISYKQAHSILGHVRRDIIMNTAKARG